VKRSIAVLLALMMFVSASLAETSLTASLDGTTVQGEYTPAEKLKSADLVVVGATDRARYVLNGAWALTSPKKGKSNAFSIDLAVAQGSLLVTDDAGDSQTLASLTDEQLTQLLSGELYVLVYRAGEHTDEDLLAECAVDVTVPQMTLSSEGIVNGVLADAFGKKGEQLSKGIPTRSPPLTLTNIPKETEALAVTMIDPDGGDWAHWLATGLPVETEFPENGSVDLADQLTQGKNSFGKIGYGGPTPPSGTHTYVITVYALAQPLSLKKGFSLKKLNKAMAGLVLAQAMVTGDYSK
jgi:Raf kinase inhibitor-like YbhB/YbcL family protein